MRLQQEGTFLARIVDYGLYRAKSSQAVAVDLVFETIAWIEANGSQSEYLGCSVRGRVFVIGRNGDALSTNIEYFSDATGWDGDLSLILDGNWSPNETVRIKVEKEENGGKEYYNAVGVYPADWSPSAGNVDPNEGRAIAQRYSSALKSIIKKRRRQQGIPENPSAPTSAPTGPPPEETSSKEPEELTPEAVWQIWLKKCKECGHEDEKLPGELWPDLLKSVAGEKAVGDLTQEELRKMAEADPDDVLCPF